MASRQAYRLLAVASTFVIAISISMFSPAHAQDDGPAEEVATRVLQLVKDANDEFDRGEYDDALEIYQEAYDLYPDPVLLYRIGLSAEKEGDLPRAVESYEAFLEASDEDDATARRVAKKLPDLRAELAPVVVVTSTPEGADVFVGEIGDEPAGQTPVELQLASGKQQIIVRLDGYRLVRRDVELENGERQEVEVELEELRKLATVDPEEQEAPAGEGSSEGESNIGMWGWIAGGTGVALLGTGAVFSILTASATSDVNDYDKRAPGASPEELEDLKNQARSLYSTSIATYIVGGVFTAIGGALLAVDFLTNSDPSAAEKEAALRLRVVPTASGGWVGLSGRF